MHSIVDLNYNIQEYKKIYVIHYTRPLSRAKQALSIISYVYKVHIFIKLFIAHTARLKYYT